MTDEIPTRQELDALEISMRVQEKHGFFLPKGHNTEYALLPALSAQRLINAARYYLIHINDTCGECHIQPGETCDPCGKSRT